MNDKIDLTDITFLIPVRIDSIERVENIVCVTSYLLKYFKTNIIICEADAYNNGLIRANMNSDIVVYFVKDTNFSFHRTLYINELVRVTTTPFIAVWDTDVVINPQRRLR